ncbi:high affinity cAMP-specific and IBMX-insensitive 3',5'-cyclic phosphodiesterase 8A-like isoform X2 [Dermacentor albipictus]|uniref:high affinity cAMP-specific and IBMX-insensitive 3',5'-cyclic phosphodiesterase 8A-like isoform X2 n=1 Tax=Dermacentor albipictus TaxID=60249 RepID=UPI0031FC6930
MPHPLATRQLRWFSSEHEEEDCTAGQSQRSRSTSTERSRSRSVQRTAAFTPQQVRRNKDPDPGLRRGTTTSRDQRPIQRIHQHSCNMAPPQQAAALQEADEKYKAALQRLVIGEGTVALKYGSMYFAVPTVRVMFVFTKDDAQYSALRWAVEKMHYVCSLSTTTEEAVENFLNCRPHLVFIDARSKNTIDPILLCRTLCGYKWSQYSCIVAVVKKGLADRQEAAIVPLLRAGYKRWMLETCSTMVCLNEIIQIEHNDLMHLWKLMTSEALFSALHYVRDGVIVTGPTHEIQLLQPSAGHQNSRVETGAEGKLTIAFPHVRVQFMNRAAEKLVGYSVEEMLGEDAQELHRTDSLKEDVAANISDQLEKGRAWEGTLFNRRKNGECVPVWSKIAPVDNSAAPGKLDHVVYIKENPFLMDKPFPPEAVVFSRRQSYAKYHAMVIEAPVTKVIKLLMATQENSPPSVAQALEGVMDILHSTDLYNPQLAAGQEKTEDQMTTDLVAGLTGTGQKPTGVRRLSHETALMKVNVVKASAAHAGTSVSLPSLVAAPTRIKDLLDGDVKWEFDVLELEALTGRRPLIWLGLSLFAKMNVPTSIECDDATIRNWLQLIESHYQDNPYHNSTHAADVMQATAYFLLRLRKKDIFDPLDEAICLISAVFHDVDHPGKSSPFLCNSDHELAILYNDRSVLESHHAAYAFKLTLSDEKVNIFQNMDRDVYRTARTSIIDMVLATEMTKHFEHLSKFLNCFQKPLQETEMNEQEAMQERGEALSLRSPDSLQLIKRMLIKCADVSNPARPTEFCIQWAHRIAEEYCGQTDEEKRRGLPVAMPAFDRAMCNVAGSQTGFINYFVRDMFKAWSDFGDFPELMEYIDKNFIYWKDKEPPSTQQGSR